MTIEKILKLHYGLGPVRITPMEGYGSSNYKVQNSDRTFVLKKHENTATIMALLASENRILQALSAVPDYEYPSPIPSLQGQLIVTDKADSYRLLSFLEGNFLGNVLHSPDLLRSFGCFLATTDRDLQKLFEAPVMAREIPWDLTHFLANYEYLRFIPDARDRNLVDYFFLQFETHVLPLQYQLPKRIIHNDANDWNVLTKDGLVSGIIDFGDMCHGWGINEVAVAITYVMMDKDDPLATASEVLKGYHAILPLQALELDVLYYLVAARLCTSVCNSARAKINNPNSEYITISEKGAWHLLRIWLQINPIGATNAFRQAVGYDPLPGMVMKEQLRRRNKLMSSSVSLSYENPIPMVQSAFQYMYDSEGNTFLDAYNNIMLVGHCHPKVVRAGQKSMARLNTNTRYVYDEILNYGENLLSHFPASLNKIFLVNSGSAATDLALRIAKMHRSKSKIMALEHGYHGNTIAGMGISDYKLSQEGGGDKPHDLIVTPMPKAFGSGLEDNGEAGAHFAAITRKQIKDHHGKIAAFIAEPLMGCGGQVPLAKGYLHEAYKLIRAQGGICISDEVQVGFGRLGTHFWGYEMHGVVPDIVILGKPMGNGHPIGAVITSSELAQGFESGPEFFSSFGGNPVSCAIGNAVLEVIKEEKLQQHAKTTGAYLMALLSELQQEDSRLADIRGSGLFLGIELLTQDDRPGTALAVKLANCLREKLILIGTDGPFNNVLKIKPPLSFTKLDAKKLVLTMQTILREILIN